ncbi:hypothetical protein WICMUC_002448 [Wickerhamomyces mucosus]|uniref:DNA 3'-phosphatase n=1 Tax=Wickerhamomyces mucosus TaxID=1378264 RepID=A0A9P8PPF9_9ASCO|nr:hypothetical protein WICMUC_002448 [Wickerhamomyces mucosus]
MDILGKLSAKSKITKNSNSIGSLKRNTEGLNNIGLGTILNNAKVIERTEIRTFGQFKKLKKTHKPTVYSDLIKVTPLAPGAMSSNPIFFDLDDTLIKTKSGGKFSRSPEDWKWYNDKIVKKLRSLKDNAIVIVSNQAAVAAKKDSKSLSNILSKIEYIFADLQKDQEININNFFFFASTNKKGVMRKPEIGIFNEFKKVVTQDFDYTKSLFIGDAAGRNNDFSDSDLKFAQNAGLIFKIPEDFF